MLRKLLLSNCSLLRRTTGWRRGEYRNNPGNLTSLYPFPVDYSQPTKKYLKLFNPEALSFYFTEWSQLEVDYREHRFSRNEEVSFTTESFC
jgi:hypothetical protein